MSSWSQVIGKDNYNCSALQENTLKVKRPARVSSDTPLTATEVILGETLARIQLSNLDLQPIHENLVLQGPDELDFLPSKGATRRKSIKSRIRHAWMKINQSGIDSNYTHLPPGLNKRIDLNKDPLKDKIRRLRRRKKKIARPVRFDELPQQYPDPIYWPAPRIKRDAPRQAPPVRPQMVFMNTGPAYDDYRNPLGGEHSVLYEREEGRELRNRATQLALRERSVSDRFLALHGQRHIRNSLIGRAPPISRRYIQQEVQRRVVYPNKKTQERVQEKANSSPPGSTRTIASPRSPAYLGLPKHDARGFQWDLAILPSKSVPNFQTQENKTKDHLHSAPTTISSCGTIEVPRGCRVTEDGRCQNSEGHNDTLVSSSSAVASEWMDGVGNGPGMHNICSSDHESVSHYIQRPNSLRHTDSFSDNISDYSKKSDSDNSSYISNVYDAEHSSEHLAELYRREIGVLGRSSPDSDTAVSGLRSLCRSSSTALPPILSDKFHSSTNTDKSPDSAMGHVKVNTEVISELAVGVTVNQMATRALESKGDEVKLIAPLLMSRDQAKYVQGRRNPLKTPLQLEPLQSNTRYYHACQTSRTCPSPLASHSLPQGGRSATSGSQPEIDHAYGTIPGKKSRVVNPLSVVSIPRNKDQMGHVQNMSMLQTAAPGALNCHLHRAPPRLHYQTSQRQSPPKQAYSVHHLHLHSQQCPQAPPFQAEKSLNRSSPMYLRENFALDGRVIHSDKEIGGHTPLAQDGPYPRMPGRKMLSIEGLTCSVRHRAATTLLSSSHETDHEHDRQHTLQENGASKSIARPLELPNRSRPVDSLGVGLGRNLAANATAGAKSRSVAPRGGRGGMTDERSAM